jgi:DNA-binding beta-propeller fold protein YncE
MALALLAGAALMPTTAWGNNLYVTNDYGGTISEYTTSGATLNASLIFCPSTSCGIAVSGSDLFVTNGNGTIGE